MGRIFVSYAREDEHAVNALVVDLAEAGHEVWWDRSLSGGQDWWATILEQIRSCDVFVIAVSPPSMASSACGSETLYAAALQRPILPIMVKAVAPQVLPPVVAAHQILDYRRVRARARRALHHALEALSADPSPLPARVPLAPPIPGADLHEVAALVRGSAPLSVEVQHQVLLHLRFWLGRPDFRDTARALLGDLRKRPEVTQHIAGEIASTIAWLDGGYEHGPRHVGWMYVGVIFTFGLLGVVLGALNLRNPAWRPHAHVLLVLGAAWGIFALLIQLTGAS
jgi:serine/threonine kinase PknH